MLVQMIDILDALGVSGKFVQQIMKKDPYPSVARFRIGGDPNDALRGLRQLLFWDCIHHATFVCRDRCLSPPTRIGSVKPLHLQKPSRCSGMINTESGT